MSDFDTDRPGLASPRSVVGRLGGYAPICQLAVSAMSELTLARMKAPPGRLVVIKTLLRAHRENRERLTLFADEMRLARLLRHANIVELIEADVVDMQPYLVLEYIDGPSVRDMVVVARERGVPIDARLSITIAYGLCAGLDHAHNLKTEWGAPLNLVHRDVSPQNIMLTRAGCVKILDFGVARAVGQQHQTAQKGLKGKLSYTPPEYIMGTKPDRRGDIFAAGIVLWETLANQRLFFRPTVPATMHAVLSEPIQPPSAHNPTVPPGVDAVVMTALERDLEQRWMSARSMADALARAVEPYGGLMSEEEVAHVLACDFPRLVTAKRDLRPEMSNDQISHLVNVTRWPESGNGEQGGPFDGDGDDWTTTEVDLFPPFDDSEE